jgi:transposase
LEKKDYPILAELIRAIVWMNFSLQEKELTIRRLRSIFGIKTESAKKLLALAQGSENKSQESTPEKGNSKKGKHGHKPSSAFTEAKTIDIAHQALKKGDLCPSCLQGKPFSLKPGSVIRIVGQPWLQVEIYRPERLRCSACGKTFTAALPSELGVGVQWNNKCT